MIVSAAAYCPEAAIDSRFAQCSLLLCCPAARPLCPDGPWRGRQPHHQRHALCARREAPGSCSAGAKAVEEKVQTWCATVAAHAKGWVKKVQRLSTEALRSVKEALKGSKERCTTARVQEMASIQVQAAQRG
eukprot:scaffold147627_cov21-Tisochrysis_lutea.AAC.1